jgi:hypothetical protein
MPPPSVPTTRAACERLDHDPAEPLRPRRQRQHGRAVEGRRDAGRLEPRLVLHAARELGHEPLDDVLLRTGADDDETRLGNPCGEPPPAGSQPLDVLVTLERADEENGRKLGQRRHRPARECGEIGVRRERRRRGDPANVVHELFGERRHRAGPVGAPHRMLRERVSETSHQLSSAGPVRARERPPISMHLHDDGRPASGQTPTDQRSCPDDGVGSDDGRRVEATDLAPHSSGQAEVEDEPVERGDGKRPLEPEAGVGAVAVRGRGAEEAEVEQLTHGIPLRAEPVGQGQPVTAATDEEHARPAHRAASASSCSSRL